MTGDRGGRLVPDAFAESVADSLVKPNPLWSALPPTASKPPTIRQRLWYWRLMVRERITGAWAHLRGRNCDLWAEYE